MLWVPEGSFSSHKSVFTVSKRQKIHIKITAACKPGAQGFMYIQYVLSGTGQSYDYLKIRGWIIDYHGLDISDGHSLWV